MRQLNSGSHTRTMPGFNGAERFLQIKEAEREWHDAWARKHARGDYPATLAEFRERFRRVDLTNFCDGGWNWWADTRKEALEKLGDVQGLHVLDYGCGSGTLGMYLSAMGANVWGFDLSSEATRAASKAARRYELSAQFEQMDAKDLKYPDNFFDLVMGFGVLHHVIKYSGASFHLRRVLKPNARAIFMESLWDNPVINLVRRFTTTDAEAGDAHLTEARIREFGGGFGGLRIEKRHLFYMLKRLVKLPERNLAAPVHPRTFWKHVKSIDESLSRLGALRRYCGEAIIYLQK
jgi:2-polyprenyl-3-methyl-5-hydroxy-6-metoxy-1,4-benzoquinol methylase